LWIRIRNNPEHFSGPDLDFGKYENIAPELDTLGFYFGEKESYQHQRVTKIEVIKDVKATRPSYIPWTSAIKTIMDNQEITVIKAIRTITVSAVIKAIIKITDTRTMAVSRLSRKSIQQEIHGNPGHHTVVIKATQPSRTLL
jgi:hypothetical protein